MEDSPDMRKTGSRVRRSRRRDKDERPFVVLWREAVRDSRLPWHVKAQALFVSTWMNSDGTNAWMGIGTLVGLGRGKRSVLRDLAELENTGWVHVEHRASRYRTNVYEARIPQGDHMSPLTDGPTMAEVPTPTAEVPTPTVGGDTSAPERRTDIDPPYVVDGPTVEVARRLAEKNWVAEATFDIVGIAARTLEELDAKEANQVIAYLDEYDALYADDETEAA